jgi:hypothetical protein
VNAAKPATDLAVVTAGAEWRMASGWALICKFDGEFGLGTRTYAGVDVVEITAARRPARSQRRGACER